MELGFIGLGRMGANMVERLLGGGHRVVAYNRSPDKTKEVEAKGAEGAYSLAELVSKLEAPRAIWIMVPHGDPVNKMIEDLVPLLSPGDTIIDGGNSYFKESIRHAAELKEKNLEFVDVGTSGGIWGLKKGYCMMIGGPEEAVGRLKPALTTLAPPDGFLHVGPAGAGHFVKMVHNGIEYGMLQAYAEGFEILEGSNFDLDAGAISHLWNQGSVVRSWLLELAENAFDKDPGLEDIRGYVEDSGEGRWTILTAIEENVPAPAIALSLFSRFTSRQDDSYGMKFIAALRNEFGGHAVKKD